MPHTAPLPLSRDRFLLLVLAAARRRGKISVLVNPELLQLLAETYDAVSRQTGLASHHKYRKLKDSSMRAAIDDLAGKHLVSPEYQNGALVAVGLRFHVSDAEELLSSPEGKAVEEATAKIPELQPAQARPGLI